MISSRILSFAVCIVLFAVATVSSQPKSQDQAVSDYDGIPVLVKHLPDWEAVRTRATFATSVAELKAALGERSVLDQIDFAGGTEAVTAKYDAGTLLIIEYATPQASIEADAVFSEAFVADSTTVYRRIGNYNAFVFDATDTAAANALLDQVQYEKDVQWLGKNPFIIDPERAFILQITDIFMSTVLWILLGVGVAILGGTIAGFMYFRRTDQRRAQFSTFSDAGGMTRLNLDGFTAEVSPEHLLKH